MKMKTLLIVIKMKTLLKVSKIKTLLMVVGRMIKEVMIRNLPMAVDLLVITLHPSIGWQRELLLQSKIKVNVDAVGHFQQLVFWKDGSLLHREHSLAYLNKILWTVVVRNISLMVVMEDTHYTLLVMLKQMVSLPKPNIHTKLNKDIVNPLMVNTKLPVLHSYLNPQMLC
jgi:hypothetical protein